HPQDGCAPHCAHRTRRFAWTRTPIMRRKGNHVPQCSDPAAKRTGPFGSAPISPVRAFGRRLDNGAGFDMAGSARTPQALAGSDRPLLLFGAEKLDPTQAASWAEFRRNQRGPAFQLSLAGSTHHTFNDGVVLVPQMAPIVGFPPEFVTPSSAG